MDHRYFSLSVGNTSSQNQRLHSSVLLKWEEDVSKEADAVAWMSNLLPVPPFLSDHCEVLRTEVKP